jgi:anthranilate synthase/aminodeoxychorismate synthase-like glutamine amidotransferase
MRVFRNDAIDVAGVRALNPSKIVVSPGPCTPNEAGISVELIRALGPEYPILGVCLGHQSIGQAYGGNIVRADRIMHGKTSQIRHFGDALFAGVASPFTATRYHSLIIERASCPASLTITAETDEGEIMAVRHETYPVFGVQFHPESILTDVGKQIIANFLAV